MPRLRRSLRGLAAVAGKESREICRDPITLGIAVILPLVMMFLFSYAITLDLKDIPLAVVDEDHSPESRAYVVSILRSGYFRLHAALQDLRTVTQVLDRGAARVAVVIPTDFSRTLGQGVPAEVQILLDGSFPNTAIVARNYLKAITQTYETQLRERTLAARFGRLPRVGRAIRVEPRVRYSPALRSEYFVVPGLFAVIASFRAIPATVTAVRLTITHDYYDHRDADRDINIVFPLKRLRELAALGEVGEVAPVHVGFMGHIDGDLVTVLQQQTAPVAAARLRADAVDVALLFPA